jgi:hypothetical protein
VSEIRTTASLLAEVENLAIRELFVRLIGVKDYSLMDELAHQRAIAESLRRERDFYSQSAKEVK